MIATLWQAAAAAMVAVAVGGPAAEATPAPALTFDNVRLLVVDFDRTFLFYRDVLGLTPTWGKPGDNYASFRLEGGGQIGLFKRALMADAVGAAARPATRQEQDTAALVLATGDVDALYARLRDKGVTFVAPPETRGDWGIRAAHFRDPDGTLIEIFSSIRK